MYKDLIDILRKQGLFTSVAAKDLNNSECPDLEIPVLDFIEIKTKFQKETKTDQLPSVNGIIFPDENKLLFVQSEKYYGYYPQIDPEALADLYYTDELKNKIEGTFETLSNIASHYGINNLTPSPEEKIKTVVMANIDARQYLQITLSKFDKKHLYVGNPIFGEIELMDCKQFESSFSS